MARIAGKLGYKPRDFSVKVPVLEAYLTNPGSLPAAPPVVDRESRVSSWPMYANDTLGDCTVAGMLHAFGALTAFSGLVPGGVMFTDAEAVTIYSAVGGYVPGNPGTDQGATLMGVCGYMHTTGAVDVNNNVHKLAAYAEIGDYTNIGLLKKVLFTFGTVYVAVNLPNSAMTQFSAGQPWTPVHGSGIDGGHCIVMQLNAANVLDGSTFITWGAEQKASNAWILDYVCEAVAIVSQDWIEANGVSIEGLNLAQLVADTKLV